MPPSVVDSGLPLAWYLSGTNKVVTLHDTLKENIDFFTLCYNGTKLHQAIRRPQQLPFAQVVSLSICTSRLNGSVSVMREGRLAGLVFIFLASSSYGRRPERLNSYRFAILGHQDSFFTLVFTQRMLVLGEPWISHSLTLVVVFSPGVRHNTHPSHHVQSVMRYFLSC